MKQLLTIILVVLFPLLGCGQNSGLTKAETELANKLGFKTELLAELKSLSKGGLDQLPAIDPETGDVLDGKLFNGIYSVTIDEESAVPVVKKLKSKFRDNGYLIFAFDGEEDKSGIAVIKGTDDLDILRYRRTDGINYDLENGDIVDKISKWKTAYGLVVVGCGRDWLHVEFDKLPADLDKFAKEVYEFCPDSVEQGTGTVELLKEAIKEMHGIWLWWD